ALILVDHQVGLMTGVRDYSTGELKHNVVALAKAARALKLPIIATTTARDSMWGPTFPELVEALPGIEIIDRSSVNAFDDARVARAIEATGRKKLIFAGISLEVCAAFPAITAVGKGLDAYVAVDASGTFSETKRQVGLLRMLQAGVILSDYATLMVEILDGGNPQRQRAAGGRRSLRRVGPPDRTALDTDWPRLYYSDMNDAVATALIHAAQRVEERLEEVLAGVELSCAKFGALGVLVGQDQPISLSELAEKLTCVRSNVTQLVDRLEADGLAKRIDHPADRRAVRAEVTALGRERHATGATV